MTILKIYDTVLEARKEAEYAYWLCKDKGFNVTYHAVHPYKIEYGLDSYIYMINRSKYWLGLRFDKIEDYTKSGDVLR